MHFALPPRKSSHPPPYAARSSRVPMLRRSRLQFIALCFLGVISFIFIFRRIASTAELIPSDAPRVVIVTTLDHNSYSASYIQDVKDNRIEYARKHGYATFFPNTTTYDLSGSPDTWSRVPAMRHALTLYPYSSWYWYLDQNSLIMNPEITVEEHITNPKRLESLMIKDQPIVPPDSVIRTFPHLHGDQIDLILSQDADGLSQRSFFVRRGEWAKYFLDAWFDPLYRSYNFQKADTHALEHVVQWHPTILSKLALISQRTMNAYNGGRSANSDGGYQDGDFVIAFPNCEYNEETPCEKEAELFSHQWRTIFRSQ